MEDKTNNSAAGKRQLSARQKILLMLVGSAILLAGTAGVILLKASDNPAFCGTCHIMRPYFESWSDSQLLAAKHSAADVECHDCHEATIATQMEEGFKYVTGSYEVPLEKRVFTKEFCLECHDDFDSIKAATDFEEGNPHDSHNGEQECNLCHSMHQPSQAMCSQCHFFSWVNELDEGWNMDV